MKRNERTTTSHAVWRAVQSLQVLLLLLAGGCGSGEKEVIWKEKVDLADGSAIQIDRYVRFHWQRSFGIGGGSTGEGERESRLTIDVAAESLPVWSGPLIPALLDRDPVNHEFVLVATSESCEYWNAHGEPDPPYWTFRLHGGQWKATDIPESFYGRRPNLFFNYNAEDGGRLATDDVESRKRSQIRHATVEHLRTIIRRSRDFGCTHSYKPPAKAVEGESR
ncbi:MAG: hypothetical protein WDO56_29275 [Gammaproteobacteria bacterium]